MIKFLSNIRWIYHQCNNEIPYVVILIIIGSVNSIFSVGIALISKSLIDSITSYSINNTEKYTTIMAAFLLLNLILYCLQTIISTLGYEKARNQIQQKIYDHIISSHLSDTSKYHSVELLTRITNDVQTIVNILIAGIPSIFSFSIMFIFSFFALLKLSSELALIALIILPILVFIGKFYGRKLKFFYFEGQKKESECNRFLQESFNNILIVKSFCLENIRKKNLAILHDDRFNISLKRSYFSCISNGFFSLSSIIGYFCVFIWGSINLSLTNATANFGNLIAMLQLFSNMQTPISGLASSFPQLIAALAAVERLRELEKLQLENILLESNNNQNSNLLLKDTVYYSNPFISLKNVTFEYVNNEIILDNVSLNIDQGETIALIGSSGEGKTTLIKLILSLLYPIKGEIYINQVKLSPSHRHLISYVPQGNTLFSGSIFDNLTLGNPSINYDEIIEALKISCAYDFVFSLNKNLNTIIGERGFGLSEGQAQRLTIARALLRKKPILILDEATSSLDSQTELDVLAQIKKLQPKPLCIIITHRISALSICDKIVKLKNKNIVVYSN